MTHAKLTSTTAAFADLDRIGSERWPLDRALNRIADLARRTIPGAADASVTLLAPGGAHTAAYTGRTALVLDEWQYEHGHGPCLAAATAHITVSVADTAGEARWPDWAGRAVDAGVHSCLSIGLPHDRFHSGALNVYGALPDAYDQGAVVLAQTFAGYAAVAVANARPADTTRPDPATPEPAAQEPAAREPVAQEPATQDPAAPESTTLDSRFVIERAKSLIMADRRCSAEDALAVLDRVSSYSQRTVPDVAAMLVSRTGDPPGFRRR